MTAGSLQREALGMALTTAARRLHAAEAQTRATESLTLRLLRNMAERVTKILDHAAAAPASHWTGRSAAELAQCAIVVRDLRPHAAGLHARPSWPTASLCQAVRILS